MVVMLNDRDSERPSVFRNPLLYSTVMLVITGLVVGWIFFSRWRQNRAFDERAAEQVREQDARTVQLMGGDTLQIQYFYGSPATIHRGEKAQLCYGVANAKKVNLDPPVTEVWPSYGQCVDVSPKKDTTYFLTVQDAAGNTKTEKATISVR
jgi:hypothetical protein